LVERGRLLRDQRRVAQDDAADLRAEANAARPRGSRPEQDPHVLVVRLIGAVTAPEAQVVSEAYDVDQFGQRVFWQELQAEIHRSPRVSRLLIIPAGAYQQAGREGLAGENSLGRGPPGAAAQGLPSVRASPEVEQP